jgi:hypothetical protein
LAAAGLPGPREALLFDRAENARDYLNKWCRKPNRRKRATIEEYIQSSRAPAESAELLRSALGGDEKALWSNDPIPQYSVLAGDTRVLLVGAEQVTKPVCDQLVREISAKGMTATCVPPGQPRK